MAIFSFPTATVLVAMSSEKPSDARPGAANAIGFVLKRGSLPKVGTTERWVVPVVAMPMTPSAEARLL